MSKTEQQRQRKLAKKKSKDREKQLQAARLKAQLVSLGGKVLAASSGEVHTCLISDDCHNGTGIGWVTIARRMSGGMYLSVVFLIDMFCLGVKDVNVRPCGPADLREMLESMDRQSGYQAVTPGVARGFVEAAVAYAANLGLAPHADYSKAAGIWGQIEALPVPAHLTFGKNGRPTYIAGPHDDNARQNMIFRKLAEHVGEGNFDFVIAPQIDDRFGSFPSIEFSADDDDDDFYDEVDDEVDDMNAIDGVVIDRIDSEHAK